MDEDERNYVEQILIHAQAQPERVALERPGRSVTYGALPGEMDRLAGVLAAFGASQGDCLGVMVSDPVEDALLRAAAALTGVLTCSLDPALDAAARAERAALYRMDGWLVERAHALGLAGERVLEDAAGAPAIDARSAARRAAGALLMTTSGTTGTPTALIASHGAVLRGARLLSETGLIDPVGRFLNPAPVFSNAGVTLPQMVMLAGGTHVTPGAIASPGDLVSAIAGGGITSLFVPSMLVGAFVQMAAAQGREAPLFPEVRSMCAGGDVLDPAVMAAAARLVTPGIRYTYASSDSGVLTLMEADELAGREGSSGRPLEGVVIEVVDAEDRPLPVGATGVIRARPPIYPEEVRGSKSFSGGVLKDGWVYPGDLGRLDDAGYLYVLGRTADAIERDGAMLHPAQIELPLRGCPGVAELTVAAVPHAAGPVPVAFFVPEAKDGADADALARFAAAALPEGERPHAFVAVDAIPRNQGGKALRRELAARYAERVE